MPLLSVRGYANVPSPVVAMVAASNGPTAYDQSSHPHPMMGGGATTPGLVLASHRNTTLQAHNFNLPKKMYTTGPCVQPQRKVLPPTYPD